MPASNHNELLEASFLTDNAGQRPPRLSKSMNNSYELENNRKTFSSNESALKLENCGKSLKTNLSYEGQGANKLFQAYT